MNEIKSLRARRAPLATTTAQRVALEGAAMGCALRPGNFEAVLRQERLHLAAQEPVTLQLNLGKLCNMTCTHCHVDAGPDRTDAMMSDEVVRRCVELMDELPISVVDLTGGAPEMHPRFLELVRAARGRGLHVIDRCNLTILLVPRYAGLAAELAELGVEIAASLPHWLAEQTDAQRGEGTMDKSLRVLRELNALGYGEGHPDRVLTLISNPQGTELPGCQEALEAEWKERLREACGVRFDNLHLITNMPISRFLEALLHEGALDDYMQKLLSAFNPCAVAGLMCRDTLSVGWDGRVYDCDFNQMLGIDARTASGDGLDVFGLDAEMLGHRPVQTGRHCFGCTAGSGSSCRGAMS